MNIRRLSVWLFASVLCLSSAMVALPGHAATKNAEAQSVKLDNATCLTCHDGSKGKLELTGAEGKKRVLRAVSHGKYEKSVHSKMECVACHTHIVDNKAGHKKSEAVAPDCATCHLALWEQAQSASKVDPATEGLEKVAKNVEAYKQSFHAKPDKDHPEQPKASCTQCHDTHAFHVPADKKSPEYAAWRLEIPAACGTCHDEQLETYSTSIHGQEVLEKGNAKAAVCTSCHTSHEITNTSLSSFKLLISDSCGECHTDRLASYKDTYHGQVTNLGGAETAKCYNCHGSHEILPVEDPASTVHVDNRLKTCQKCHDGKKRALATEGFVTFGPHANSHDFAKYPQLWVTTKFMQGLLIAVFAFFWSHSLLWYYREWQERKNHKPVPHIRTEGLEAEGPKYYERFAWGWRIGHLVFALITMTLVLTGTAALFAHSDWAPVVASMLGGAKGMALIHRVAAALFVSVFLIHFVYVMQKLLRSKTFRWFGPDSLIPNWKDLADCIGMFKWFFGKGPKPQFERWAYYEKFDYWAVFWGVNIIGFSGLSLALPAVTATYLPGWVFNVATMVHGEEAFLAAVFLFTVHFFNNHFRPDKLPPPDVVMFTGLQSLEEFRADHPAQYQRLLESGELQSRLVDGPSRSFTLASKILGLVLIALGLTLLSMVTNGFLTH